MQKSPTKNRGIIKALKLSKWFWEEIVCNSIVKSQLSYCCLAWMLCSRTSNNKISKAHEWALGIVLNDHTTDFKTLLQIKNNDVFNHHRNIQALLIEILKTKNGLAPPIMGSMFKRINTNWNPRNFQEFETERKRTVYFGLEILS